MKIASKFYPHANRCVIDRKYVSVDRSTEPACIGRLFMYSLPACFEQISRCHAPADDRTWRFGILDTATILNQANHERARLLFSVAEGAVAGNEVEYEAHFSRHVRSRHALAAAAQPRMRQACARAGWWGGRRARPKSGVK
jgi:hypothetical protein